MKNLLLYSCLALLALLAGLGALSLSGTVPFGSHTLCWQDNGQQVASDFGYLRGVWEGRHTLDWSYACGGAARSSFHPTFNNLCSPLTWAGAALPGISAVTGLSLLFLLQIALLPLGAFFYLRGRFPRLPAPLGMALALAYAFGGFVMSKYTFLPFLNIALLFPWFAAALDALLRRGRWLPYCLLLAFMLAVGTYFAYMWLLFAAVYAAARTGWRQKSAVRQHNLTLFLASAGALLLSAWSWLPSLFITAASARAGEAHFWWNATRAELEPSALVHLLSLPAALFLLILLPTWRHLRVSRYALTLAVLAVGLACVSATSLWHLSRPWDFAGRFGYMADFMLICLTAQLAQRERIKALVLLPVAAVCGSFVFGIMLWDSALERPQQALYQASAERLRIVEWAAEQLPAAAEGAPSVGRAKARGHAAVENLAFLGCRAQASPDKAYSAPFDSMSHFTACITKAQEETLARWGYQQRAAVISTEGGTLATDTLLGMRYFLAQEEDGAPYRLEENPYYFGMGLMVPPGIFPLRGDDPIARQQDLWGKLLGAEYAGSRSRQSAWETPNLSADFLHYLQQPTEGGSFMVENDPLFRWWGGVEARPRLCEIPAGCRWVGCRAGSDDHHYDVYHLPPATLDALRRFGQELPVRCEYAGRFMHIRCRSTEERPLVFLPMLWQEHYRVTVDGQAGELLNLDGFVGIPMPAPGEHLVCLEYRNPWRTAGSICSLLALVGLPIARFCTRRRPTLAPQGRLNALCRSVLLELSALLLFWPLLTLPVALLW